MDIKRLTDLQAKLEPRKIKEGENKLGKLGSVGVRKLVAGFEKLENFFKTLKWESRQEVAVKELSKYITELDKEIKNFTQDAIVLRTDLKKEEGVEKKAIKDWEIKSGAESIASPFVQLALKMGDELQVMKEICKLLKNAPEAKLGKQKNALGEAETKIGGLIEDLQEVLSSEKVKPGAWEHQPKGKKLQADLLAGGRGKVHAERTAREETERTAQQERVAQREKDRVVRPLIDQVAVYKQFTAEHPVEEKFSKAIRDLEGLIRQMNEKDADVDSLRDEATQIALDLQTQARAIDPNAKFHTFEI